MKIHRPHPSTPKGNSKFEILLVEIFSLKEKSNKIHTAIKSNYVSPTKQRPFPSDLNF